MTTTVFEDDWGFQVVSAANGLGPDGRRHLRLEFTDGKLERVDEVRRLAEALQRWADAEDERREPHECYWRGCPNQADHIATVEMGGQCRRVWGCSEHIVWLNGWQREGK